MNQRIEAVKDTLLIVGIAVCCMGIGALLSLLLQDLGKAVLA